MIYDTRQYMIESGLIPQWDTVFFQIGNRHKFNWLLYLVANVTSDLETHKEGCLGGPATLCSLGIWETGVWFIGFFGSLISNSIHCFIILFDF